MNLALMLDLFMIVLLLVTIGYAYRLHRDLGRLRKAKDEMAAFIKSFDESYGRAESAIARLKQVDSELMAPLRREIDRAQALRDELAFLGNRVRASGPEARPGTAANTDGQEARPGMASRHRQAAKPFAAGRAVVPDAGSATAAKAGVGAPRSRIERELLDAIRAAGGGR